MVKTFHGGIKKQKRLFASPIGEGEVKIKCGVGFRYCVPEGGVCVSAGDDVSVGSVLACVEGNSPVLSGVSGKVDAVDGSTVTVISDGLQKRLPPLPPFEGSLSEISADEVAVRLSDCAVSSKYSPNGIFSVCKEAQTISGEKRIKLIIDCTSPTSALSANRYLIKHFPNEISGGIRILMRACDASVAHLVCDDSSMDVIRTLESICDGEYVRLSVAEAKYPMQNEKLLIYLALNKEVSRKKRTVDYGIVCADCEAALNAYNAAALGERAVTRLVAVSGRGEIEFVNVPQGLPMSELLRGGESELSVGELSDVTLTAAEAESVYVDGATDAVVVSEPAKKAKAGPCVGCGKCEEACPMYLPVSRIVPPTLEGIKKAYKKYSFSACIGCGCCSAVCPSGIEIRNYIEGGRKENEQ